MSSAPRDIQKLLQRVQQGALAELTPAEFERLAAAAETDAAIAAQLAALPAEPPASWPAPPPPSAERWDAVWSNIERTAQREGARGREHERARETPRSRLGLRMGSGWRSRWFGRMPVFAAAAAIVLMVGLWRLNMTPTATLQLMPDRDAAFLDVSTSGDDTAMVMLSTDNETFPVLWIVEDTSDRG